MSNDETNSEIDLYQEGASITFAVPYAQVTKIQRAFFKERFFYFVYHPRTNKKNIRSLVKIVAEGLRLQLKESGDTKHER